jgi:predicted PurR-regulated permease PerM
MIALLAAVANVVPFVAKYLSGTAATISRVGDGVSSVVKAVGGSDDFHTALANITGNGEKVAALNLELAKLENDWDKAMLEDRENARQMNVDLAKAGVKNRMPAGLAVLAVALTALLVLVVLFIPNLSEWAKSVIMVFLGRSLGWVDDVYAFVYGSTQSNKDKDSAIANLSK